MSTQVMMHLGDAHLIVEPVLPEFEAELVKRLSYFHKELVDEGYGRRASRGEMRQLCQFSEQVMSSGHLARIMITGPGMACTIYNELARLGVPAQFIDERTPRPAYDLKEAVKGLRPYQLPAAEAMLVNGGGVLKCPTGWGKTRLAAAVIRAHKRQVLARRGTPLSIMVTPSLDLCIKNWKALTEIMPERQVGLQCSRKHIDSNDVVVVSADSLDSVDLPAAGILIFDEVHQMTYKRAGLVAKATRALRWGMSASPTGRFDGADLLVTYMFGPVVYNRSYAGAVQDGAIVPIQVLWLPVPAPPLWVHHERKDVAKRHGIWRNVGLHKMVGSLLAYFPAEWQVVGVAETLEHLDGLYPLARSLCPELRVVHAETSADKIAKDNLHHISSCSPAERQKVYDGLADGTLQRVISTGIYRQGVDFPNLRVVINLSGMGSEILAQQLPGRASRIMGGKECGILIDFRHNYDTRMERDGEIVPGHLLRDDLARERVYSELGFDQAWLNNVEDIKVDDANRQPEPALSEN